MRPSGSGRLALLLTGLVVVLGNAEAAHADLIQYDARSGVLPSDLSIPAEHRFEEPGAEFGFSTVVDGVLRVQDTSTVNETRFFRTSPQDPARLPAGFEQSRQRCFVVAGVEDPDRGNAQ